jgi:hypothetical protein
MSFCWRAWLSSVLLVSGCGDVSGLSSTEGSGVESLSDSGSDISTDTFAADVVEPFCPPPASDMCNGAVPSYAADVVPILDKRCNNCHAENSDGGPWPLGGYDDVSAWRDTIMNDLLRCTMPPADAGAPMPNAERAVLMAWIICGTPDN